MKNIAAMYALVVKAEFIKLRRTVALWLTFLYPLGSVLLASLFIYSMRNQKAMSPVAAVNNINNVAAFFLPFYIVLTISFFCLIENRNNMLKYIISLPVPRHAFFIGKLLASFALMAITLLLLLIFSLVSFLLLAIINSKTNMLLTMDYGYLITVFCRTIIAGIAMTVIQYILSLRLKNVVAPIAIGISLAILPIAVLFVLGVTGVISNPQVLTWLPLYDPYTYPYSHFFNIMSGPSYKLQFLPLPSLVYLFISIALVVFGVYEFNHREIK
ncbi:MAG TPA: ABC transporter permease, partial [Bacteroidales bacterium]|nr:ABC transporter permease [Bacteroidales bacterium]